MKLSYDIYYSIFQKILDDETYQLCVDQWNGILKTLSTVHPDWRHVCCTSFRYRKKVNILAYIYETRCILQKRGTHKYDYYVTGLDAYILHIHPCILDYIYGCHFKVRRCTDLDWIRHMSMVSTLDMDCRCYTDTTLQLDTIPSIRNLSLHHAHDVYIVFPPTLHSLRLESNYTNNLYIMDMVHSVYISNSYSVKCKIARIESCIVQQSNVDFLGDCSITHFQKDTLSMVYPHFTNSNPEQHMD